MQTLLKGSERAKPRAQFLGHADPNKKLEITVTIRPKNAMPQQAERLSTPMTAQQIEALYGASRADVDTVVSALGKYNLKPEIQCPEDRSVTFSGTVADMERAFGTKLDNYRTEEEGEFRGREGALTIPAELDGIVTGVFGLDDRRVARHRTAVASGPANGLQPADLAKMYNFGGNTASGQTVGVLEFGGGYSASDMSKFCSSLGISVPNLQVIQVPQGAEGSPTDDTSVEVMMDVQIVAAMAQGANIMLYFAQWSQRGWVNLLKHIVHSGGQKPNVISISYGVSEESGDFSASAMNVINGYFMEAANMGITICVSAGDDGCGSLDFDGKYHANFPATSPNVMAIGGTMIDYSGANPQEVTWWETPGRRFDQNNNSTGGGSTGGGVSTVFSRPTWQTVTTASLNDGSTTGRCVPDVSALAGPPFYYLIFNGQTSPNGGTSAAAPMWASVLAVLGAAGKKINFFTPVLYGMDTNGKTIGQNVCNDITIGNNASNPPATGYQAGPGYDAVTGWGTPNVTAMINNPNI